MWPGIVTCGHDLTLYHFSPSSNSLARILATGLTLIGAKHVDYGNDP